MDKKSKINQIFIYICICFVLWSGGYAMMLTSDNINIAFFWRNSSVLGYCFFNGLWLYFAYLLNNTDDFEYISIIKFLAYVPTTILFIGNVIVEPYSAMTKEYYGWIDVAPELLPQILYIIWAIVIDIAGVAVLYLRGKYSKKNRVKKQTKVILITCTVSIIIGIITDFVLPLLGLTIFPSAVLTGTIALGGIYYAINRHRLMSTTPKYISEYIFNTVNEPIFILNEKFIIQNCNDASLSVTNYKIEELEGKIFSELLSDVDFDLSSIMKNAYAKNIEVDLETKYGNNITCELSATIIYDEYSDILGILILLHDISERKKILEMERNCNLKLEEANMMLKNQIQDKIRAEEKIRHFVYYDPLTELPNRKMMLEKLNVLLEIENNSFAMFFIDLDGFKSINDNYGHQVGDKVLKNVADTLKGIISNVDIISRIGGDEFVIITTDIKFTTYVKEIAERIQNALKTPFIYNEEALCVGASIGISVFPEHGKDADTLIRKADVAMYEVKKKGGYDYALYSSKINDEFLNKMNIKEKLNKAMENNEFIIYYQPIISLRSMKVLYSEALIRWKQGDKIISPIEFIPIAKSVGEIISIDNWVLENACKQCEIWHELGGNEFSISVNVSYSQLKQSEFIPMVENILNHYSFPARCLNMEITEDEAMEDSGTIIGILEKLRKIGVRVSLDDFGTGYSSLSYVNRLPIDMIKIDKSLVWNLEKDYKSVMIVRSIITLGHSLNLKIIAEGIETQEQFRILNELNCDYIQGYLIGKPMEALEFEHRFIKKETETMKS
ncbi:diguanylate cyclase (GGDEF)-like protein/PAS domain S-box-containing protein [Clostridium beijerinckii]|uniref:Diguanylate cyclase (GGDEF)-like protein/PAS domain S-box-containing protein n=3 Tax=Clostridium beijerinckii TaxID=1520 RepID=A0A9Q5CKM3_CLOBE|nr:EAL domain-containing protein [Clostridium beijerinckii]MBA2911683.1 diguanylate cyclase (GGDEF)-like protein/PAS domain S-box-containing protein [Clostridium beijerinckii]MBA9015193.1 diguanylate cyclase (GGDEF)-like protein/PAS domain S-box-containing protein [Clostridium beijerinckii]NRT10175.1 diguanylate cyclase (GGDEF)-like protein/PAS domain S-box-containing protein [Clostridium beijerinckii]NRT28370.1 diguanylate cyclase (GGDEF)-like protein/PAS domain S-box-containing protein [Clost